MKSLLISVGVVFIAWVAALVFLDAAITLVVDMVVNVLRLLFWCV